MNTEDYIKIIKDELEGVASEIITGMLDADAVATGKTMDSLEVVDRPTGASLLGGKAFNLSNSRRLPFIEGGRGAGRVPAYRDIAEWCVARGLASSVNDTEIVEKIRWGIYHHGTRLHQDNAVRPVITNVVTDERVTAIANRLLIPAATQASSEILKAIGKR